MREKRREETARDDENWHGVGWGGMGWDGMRWNGMEVQFVIRKEGVGGTARVRKRVRQKDIDTERQRVTQADRHGETEKETRESTLSLMGRMRYVFPVGLCFGFFRPCPPSFHFVPIPISIPIPIPILILERGY